MNKKGFTLVELLGVITVLAIIGVITMPIVNKTIKDSKEKAYKAQIKEIEKAAEDYTAENMNLVLDGTTLCPSNNPVAITTIDVDTLMDEGYIPEDTKDPRTEELIQGSVYVTFDCEYNSYKYEYRR